MKNAYLLLFIALSTVSHSVIAADKAMKKSSVNISKLKQEAFLPWLPNAQTTQSKIFDSMRTKTLKVPLKPKFPLNDLVKWSTERYTSGDKEKSEIYKLVYEDLLISKDLLNHKELHQRRRGLRLVTLANLYVYNLLEDHRLHSQIYEGFVLPYLDVSYRKKWQDLSEQRLVEGSANAFKRSGEIDKQISVLRLLLTLHTSQNTADWARAELAQALASQGHFDEATLYLRRIESKNWELKKALISEYEKKSSEARLNARKGAGND